MQIIADLRRCIASAPSVGVDRSLTGWQINVIICDGSDMGATCTMLLVEAQVEVVRESHMRAR